VKYKRRRVCELVYESERSYEIHILNQFRGEDEGEEKEKDDSREREGGFTGQ
jgi:hypothetical protein